MSSSPPPEKPPRFHVDKRLVYKTVPATDKHSEVSVHADVILPRSFSSTDHNPHPILLYIHGGGWIHSNASDYPAVIFRHFLNLDFVVVSMEYRLLPETSFAGMCEDVRDVEGWLRTELGKVLSADDSGEVDGGKVLVCGSSAGAHLALLIPKLWTQPPLSILSIYGPTDFHRLQYLNRGDQRPEVYTISDLTPESLQQLTDCASPPTNLDLEKTHPRRLMMQHVYRNSALPDFLCCGLPRDEAGGCRLPERGDASHEQIDAISPLYHAERITYPPVYQILGTDDHLFELHHMSDFQKVLRERGVHCASKIVKGAQHGFDSCVEVGEEIDVLHLRPAVAWVVRAAGLDGGG